MNCREFKSNHVGFIDDLLPAVEMSAMRRHLVSCQGCSTLDTRIRRSLLVVRNLPQIEPSADFLVRLNEALRQAPPPEPRLRPIAVATVVAATTAALAAAVYFAMAVSPEPSPAPPLVTPAPVAAAPVQPVSMSEVTIAASVPGGVPVWPAMFMVGEIPTHLASAELLDNTSGR